MQHRKLPFKNIKIDEEYLSYFNKFEDSDFAVLSDDSSSMLKTVGAGETQWKWLENVRDSKSFGRSFWILEVVVDVISTFDTHSFDVYLLNREPLLRVKNFDPIRSQFTILPKSTNSTLVNWLQDIFDTKNKNLSEKSFFNLSGKITNKIQSVSFWHRSSFCFFAEFRSMRTMEKIWLD